MFFVEMKIVKTMGYVNVILPEKYRNLLVNVPISLPIRPLLL